MAKVGPAVVVSEEDRRLYRHITLPNGLVALLVHDPAMGSSRREVSGFSTEFHNAPRSLRTALLPRA